MLNDRRILVVVPARGGSKGVPLKNLRTVGGTSLVAHVGRVLAEMPEVDRAVVSTDHEGIAEAARAAGIDAPFLRPPALSGDRIGDYEVLCHALEATEAVDGQRYDVIVMLQPTSPLRTPAQVRETVTRLVDGDYDAVWTVSATDLKHHPLKQLVIDDGGAMSLYDDAGRAIIARQQLTPTYHRNGIAYAFTRQCLVEQGSIYGKRMGAVVIHGPVVNIDTEDDLERANALVSAPC